MGVGANQMRKGKVHDKSHVPISHYVVVGYSLPQTKYGSFDQDETSKLKPKSVGRSPLLMLNEKGHMRTKKNIAMPFQGQMSHDF